MNTSLVIDFSSDKKRGTPDFHNVENVYAIKRGIKGRKLTIHRTDAKNEIVKADVKVTMVYTHFILAAGHDKKGRKIFFCIPLIDLYKYITYGTPIFV